MAGLRERNRARTRADIRAAALRLIVDQGYAATTVDQIAKAADVSPSTFFRYFPTKEDAVLTDDYDAPMVDVFRAQPKDISALAAFRTAIGQIFGGLTDEERAQESVRLRVIFSVPELRDRMLGAFADSIVMLSELIAEHSGRSPEDPAVLHMAGAVVGVAMTAMVRASGNPQADPLALIDEAIEALAAGLPL
ncbi:MAG TPA: TetR family transcriptional regulator [Micromonosporaceae bacterium]|jgi:AcrR family transcriptional regulator